VCVTASDSRLSAAFKRQVNIWIRDFKDLINSMEQSPSEADTCSAGQEIPCLDGSQRFNAMFKGN